MTIVVIDPSSTEFNRGSFCYAAYLTCNGLMELGHDVKLIESFRPEDIDSVPPNAEAYIIALWSYPQVETALFLHQMLPATVGHHRIYFIGFSPLIHHIGLPHAREYLSFDPLTNQTFLRDAMRSYPKHYGKYRRLLLSDCDMHLKSKDTKDLVYPLFTSYGCPNACTFCPSTLNCEERRVVLSLDDTLKMLERCLVAGIRYIHFTDEDFFFSPDRTLTLLQYMKGKGFHTIALGSSGNIMNFVKKYGTGPIRKSGLEVIEVGFETADEKIALDMGNAKSLWHCKELAFYQPELAAANVGIFWLVQTFFPGESLASLARTGEFMRTFGYEMSEVVGRLRTNGTKGGLGQFFQPYHGLPIYSELQKEGLFLTTRPIRLIPSYLPNTFLDSTIFTIDLNELETAKPWLDLYNVSHRIVSTLRPCTKVCEYIADRTIVEQIRNAMGIAILARMGVIR